MKKMHWAGFSIFVLALLIALTSIGWAAQFTDISAQELKAKLDSGEKLLLINPLSDIEFNEANIPGSINISIDQITSSDKLPQDKTTLIITYCLGPK